MVPEYIPEVITLVLVRDMSNRNSFRYSMATLNNLERSSEFFERRTMSSAKNIAVTMQLELRGRPEERRGVKHCKKWSLFGNC